MSAVVEAAASAPAETPAVTGRIRSLDVLRGLTILVMIFVNDLGRVSGVPAWMSHMHPESADGMTFVDVVFPAFLFIVGTSIPFAIGRRLDQGESLARVWSHVLVRTIGLLVIGVFMVNSETISKQGALSPPMWELLMYSGVALTWVSLPGEWMNRRSTVLGMRVFGIALLIAAALMYRGNDGTGLIQMRPQWWGILGLIGWAYLVGCAAYTALRRNLAGVVGAIALLYCVYIADSAGGLAWLGWIKGWVGIGEALGSQAAITVAGVALGMVLDPGSPLHTNSARIRWAFWFGMGLFVAGHLLHAAHDIHRMFIFNKIYATPPWCLVSSAITVWIWIVIYWLVDMRRVERGSETLTLAGQNALLAYIMAPILYAVIALFLPVYAQLGNSFAIGFWRSVVLAIAIIWTAAKLRKHGVQLKL